MALIEDTQETMIRADLWHTMSISELAKQQELLTTKISAVLNMMGPQTHPSIHAMYSALQMGMADLNKLLEQKTTDK